MPPVPKVILATPGPHAALADKRRLLVADERRDRRRAVERGGLADDARSSRRPSAATPRGMRRASSIVSSQSVPSPLHAAPVTPALVASVTCSAPSERCHASQVSTVPKHRSRVRSGSAVVEQAGRPSWPTRSGATRSPSAWSTRQVPTVRRSCQPSAGPDRLAGGAVPHDRRRALVGDADRVDRAALGEHRRGPPRARPSAIAGRRRTRRGRAPASSGAARGAARRRSWRPAARPRPAARSCRRR